MKTAYVAMKGLVPPSTKSSALESLPIEVLSIIFKDEGLAKADVLSLGLCSQFLWMQMLPNVRDLYLNSMGQLAGKSLVCVGAGSFDLLPALYKFPEDMAAEQRAAFTSPTSPIPTGIELSTVISETDLVAMGPPENRKWIKALTSRDDGAARWMSWGNIQIASSSLHHCLRNELREPLTKYWLRNLVTKELVQIMAVYPPWGPRHEHVVGASWLTLDKFLLSRVSWVGAYQPILGNESFKPGPWAGHSFDLIPAEAGRLQDGWKDVTTSLVSKLSRTSDV